MRAFNFWLRERRKKKRIFACPVCHLELSLDDLDEDGYTVCPLCGIVIEVTMAGGFPLPVVHDVEIKRDQPKLRMHSNSTHVSIGLLPIAILFSIVSLVMKYFLIDSYSYIEKLGFILLNISFFGSIITFITGFLDWKRRYRGRPYVIIYTKIKLTIVFWVLGLAAIIMRHIFIDVDILFTLPYIIYLLLQFAMLSIMAVVGHIGGNLVFGK